MTLTPIEILALAPSTLSFPPGRLRIHVRKLLIEAKTEGLIDGRKIATVEDLCRLTAQEFERLLYGVGFKSIELISQTLAQIGLRFEMVDADFEAYKLGQFKLDN